MKIKMLRAIALLMTFLSLGTDSHAWNAQITHSGLSETATEKSNLNLGVLSDLGLGNMDEQVAGRSIKNWIAQGGVLEDKGIRFFNHFHNPLSAWEQAGLTDLVGGQSALLWAHQNADWSWSKVRGYFFDALKTTTPASREDLWAKTFEGVGHLIHLVQDMAVPAHTRNDAHPLDDTGYVPQFEFWASGHQDDVGLFASSPVFPALGETLALANSHPAAPFFDTDQYQGTAGTLGLANGFTSGLSEYSNANFFSDDTIKSLSPHHQFPFPANDPDAYTRCETAPPDGSIASRRIYLSRGACGPGSIDRIVTLDVLTLFDAPIFSWFVLDDEVHRDYAKKLVPRAVGYSAGFINYFFRGRMTTPGHVSFNETRTAVSFKLYNATDEDETGPAELVVRVDYRSGETGPERSVLSFPLSVDRLAREEAEAEAITFELTNLIPINAREMKFTVAYKGRLGQEEGAVMGLVFEPKPHYVFVIQEGVTLGTTGAETYRTCVYPSCESNIFTIVLDREDKNRRWSTSSQIMTGRFVTYGEIERIDLQVFSGGGFSSGFGKLFINGQEMDSTTWRQGDTSDPPATWRVEMHSSLVGAVYLLKVVLGDDSTFILGLASYFSLYQESERIRWQINCGLCNPDRMVLTRSYSQMDLDLGYWATPNVNVDFSDQWDLVQISNYGLGENFADGREEWFQENTDTVFKYAKHAYRTSRSITIKDYRQESTFVCSPCVGQVFRHPPASDLIYDIELYNGLPLPDYQPLTPTAEYRRVYSQFELDALSYLGIEPVEYILVFD